MKIRILIFIFAFLLSMGLCLYSNQFVGNTMRSIVEKAESMERLLVNNDSEKAFEVSENLKKFLDKKSRILESLVPHEDLHDLSVQIEDIALTISIQDLDDCKKALALIKENADHLIRHEAFSIGNIF